MSDNTQTNYLSKFSELCQNKASEICLNTVEFDANSIGSKPYTYKTVWKNAHALAEKIKNSSQDRDTILIAVSDPALFFISFLATLLANRIAVPIPELETSMNNKTISKRVSGIYDSCKPTMLLTGYVDNWLQFDICKQHLTVINPTEHIHDATSSDETLPNISMDDIAFLQYTSGSTGHPKGVVITHGNLISNVISMGQRTNWGKDDTMVSWLPLYHDMGLVGGLLSQVYWQCQLYLFTPREFIARPQRWLQSLSKFRASVTVAPPFAYHVCLTRMSDKVIEDLDLSNLRLAFIGAEPISVSLLQKFNKRFESCGLQSNAIYPVYGLAESTLATSFPEPGSEIVVNHINRQTLAEENRITDTKNPNLTAQFVSVGTKLDDLDINICCPETGKTLPEKMVGEIRVKGPSISPGYYSDNLEPQRELHTGDLGYLAEGHLYVVDRLKDIIIIVGQNYYSSDIEASLKNTVSSVSSNKIVCFAINGNEGTEELVIVIELKRNQYELTTDIIKEVTQAVKKNFELRIAKLVFVKSSSLERTSSGKVKHAACKQRYLAGKLDKL